MIGLVATIAVGVLVIAWWLWSGYRRRQFIMDFMKSRAKSKSETVQGRKEWALPVGKCRKGTVIMKKMYQCAYCNRASYLGPAFRLCARCNTVHYCCTEQHESDWPRHRRECRSERGVITNSDFLRGVCDEIDNVGLRNRRFWEFANPGDQVW